MNSDVTRGELLVQLDLLDDLAESLLAQVAEATKTLEEIARERERIRLHLRSLERGEEDAV
jgi:hypothetical protein